MNNSKFWVSVWRTRAFGNSPSESEDYSQRFVTGWIENFDGLDYQYLAEQLDKNYGGGEYILIVHQGPYRFGNILKLEMVQIPGPSKKTYAEFTEEALQRC